MSRIVLLKMDGDDQVEVRTSGDQTWMDLTDRFIQFMQGCGYSVTGGDVATYLAETYGMSVSTVTVDDWGDDYSAEINTFTPWTPSK